MITKSKKKEVTFLQTQNPRTKRWIKINSKTGKIISTKKTPGKYKGVKVAKLAKPSSPVKNNPKRAKTAPLSVFNKSLKKTVKTVKKPAPARKGWATKFKKATAEEKQKIRLEQVRILQLTKAHLAQVKVETGKITVEDKTYCKSLGNRMLEYKFSS